MKKLLFLLLFIPVALMGQDFNRHQFSIGVSGFGNPADKTFNDYTADLCRQNGYDPTKRTFVLLGKSRHYMVNMSYEYLINDRLSIGATAGWGKTWCKYHDYAIDEVILWFIPVKTHTTVDMRVRSNVFYLAPTAKYYWYKSDKDVIRLYSKLSLGALHHRTVTHWNVPADKAGSTKTDWQVGYQLTPFGFEAGKGNFMIFTELGYGHQNVLNMGFRVSL